jgi:hypothetical protein
VKDNRGPVRIHFILEGKIFSKTAITKPKFVLEIFLLEQAL